MSILNVHVAIVVVVVVCCCLPRPGPVAYSFVPSLMCVCVCAFSSSSFVRSHVLRARKVNLETLFTKRRAIVGVPSSNPTPPRLSFRLSRTYTTYRRGIDDDDDAVDCFGGADCFLAFALNTFILCACVPNGLCAQWSGFFFQVIQAIEIH